jgi:type IV pilus modification protein PilV
MLNLKLFRGSNARGATLIEVMIAVLIFLVGMEALLAVSTQSMSANKRAEYVYTASTLAKNHLERLKSSSFSSLATAAETDTVINADGDVDAAGAFRRTTTVTTNYNANSNLTQVTVAVRYTMQGAQAAQPMSVSHVFYNE